MYGEGMEQALSNKQLQKKRQEYNYFLVKWFQKNNKAANKYTSMAMTRRGTGHSKRTL